MKPRNPRGERAGAISDRQSLSLRIASNEATAHAATSATPFGRVAVAMAARIPAHSQCLSRSAMKHNATIVSMSASE